MVARVLAASLGLLAFTITIVAGLYVQNPATVTLSRGILALLVFCVIGLALGATAQLILKEHEREREAEMRRQSPEEESDENAPSGLEEEAVSEKRAAARA